MKTKIIYLLFLLSIGMAATAQEMRIVSGIIKDKEGDPLIGVNIREKGTANGTNTDWDGFYEIKVPLNSILEVTFIGMKSSEMKVTESNSKPLAGVKEQVKVAESSSTIKVIESPTTHVGNKVDNEEMSIPKIPVATTKQDQSLSPYFMVIADETDSKVSLPLKKTEVEVNIAGVIADVSVKQIYINTGSNTLEAIYVFPGSTRAAVYDMSMTIGDRKIDAQIKKKEQARQEYEQAKKEGKSASLLEQERPNVFQMNVANILPGDTIIVEMKYTELLEHNNGLYEFVYPTVVGPRFSTSSEAWVGHSIAQLKNGKFPEFTIKTIIQAGMPIQQISSSSHNIAIETLNPDYTTVTLANPKDNEGTRDYILKYGLQGGQVQSGLLRYEHGDENFFLLMMQPPKSPTIDQIPPREYVFIVDVSGSMHGTPLEISKKMLENLVSSLRPIDRFNVILFESNNKLLYKESVAATKSNINKALSIINEQEGSGWTNLYPTLQKAMEFKETEGYSRTFIILTDGYVTIEKEAFDYIRNNLNKANMFPVGIGSNVSRYIIEGIAHAGMGTPYIITNFSDADEIGKKLIAEISQPVLTKIAIDWGDFDIYDVEPVTIPDVFADRPILVYGKYRGKPKGTISVSGITGDAPYMQTFDVAKAQQEYNRALRYLWARNKIRYFDDYAQYYEGNTNNNWHSHFGTHQRSTQQIEAVTNLGLKYNLLTQYTSFLAVDDRIRTAVAKDNKAVSETVNRRTTTPETVTSPSFTLADDDSILEEVLVVGYGTSRRKDFTSSSVSTISSNELSTITSLHSLQGRVAGLSISETSGEPGKPANIRIRGGNSISDNNTPLIILDGTAIQETDFSNLDTSNIDNVYILKDASGVATYGSRAANGVIVITSKKAANKKFSVQVSSSFAVESANKLPEMQSQFAQGQPVNGIPVWNKSNEAFGWGPAVGAVNAKTYDAFDVLEIGSVLRNNITMLGRENGYFYNFRYGNNTQHGITPDSKLTENTFGVRFGKDKNVKLQYNVDLDYKHTSGNRLQRGYNRTNVMQGILLTPPTFDNKAVAALNAEQSRAGNAADNPYWTIKNNPFSDSSDRLLGNVQLKYTLNNLVTLTYKLNGSYYSTDSESALNKGSVYIPGGHIMKRDEDYKALNSMLYADLKNNWNNLSLNATLGYEYLVSNRSIYRKDGYELKNAGDYTINNAATINRYDKDFKRHANAVLATANLTYMERWTLDAKVRNEWSSVDNKNLFAPSLGVAVDLDKMFYWAPISILKLRANVSKTDKEIPLYMDPNYFSSANYNLNDAAKNFERSEIILSKNLKSERLTQYELGVYTELFNNRLTFEASVYWKRNTNQYLPVQIADNKVELVNSGTYKLQGLELQLGGWIKDGRDLRWRAELIFSKETNKVTKLGGKSQMLSGITGEIGSYAMEGQPLGVLYGTAYARDAKGNLLIGSDGFPEKSSEMKVLGNPNPDWTLSTVQNIEYRRFVFSLLLEYKKGGKMWNGTRNVMNYYGTSKYSADNRGIQGFVFPGVLANGAANDIPVNFYGDNLSDNRWVRYGVYGVAEDAIEDAGYLKLRDISIGYKIPIFMLDRRTQLRLSVFARNILLYSKYKGVDPETNLTGNSNGLGLDYFNMPGAYSVGMSLNWEF